MSKQATQRLEPPVKHNKLNLQKVAPYIFVAPFLIYFLVFFLYPICETFWTSLCQQTGFAPSKFAGFANYKLLVNEYFITATQNSAMYTFFTCLILVPVPLLLAALLNSGLVWPMIVLRTTEMQTLPLGLQSLLTPYGNNYDLLLSGAVMSVLPIMIIFLLNQKTFIAGMAAGSVKG